MRISSQPRRQRACPRVRQQQQLSRLRRSQKLTNRAVIWLALIQEKRKLCRLSAFRASHTARGTASKVKGDKSLLLLLMKAK